MQIRTLLTLAVSLSILMVVGLAGSVWGGNTRLERVSEAQARSQSVARDVADLLVLTHEYALHAEERVWQQWRGRHALIIGALEAGTDDEAALRREALDKARTLPDFFDQLVTATQAAPDDFQHRRTNLLLDQMLAHTQELSDIVHRWGNALADERKDLEGRFHILVVAVPFLMLLILATLAALLARRVLRPLARLHEAVLAVSRGDLSVHCATAAADEFGVLSRTFDAMAVDLVGQLRKEIAEHTRTGQALAKANAELAADIIERKRAEDSMRLAASIYQSSIEGILVTDENNLIVDVNAAFTRITGYELDEIRGLDPKFMQSGLHDEEFYRQFWQDINIHGHWQGEIWDRRKDGALMAKWLNVSVIRNPDGSVFRHVAQFSDVTEKKQKDELIWRQANFDILTDLPNRRLFRDRLEQAIRKSDRDGQPVALFFIDLDRFKEINDTLGHDKGDILLREAAQRIRRCVRETDTLARLGGDEFTVIVPEFGDPANLERIARQINRELSAPFALGNERGHVSGSIGITVYPDDAGDLENLLKHADRAMYLAKEQGRGCFAYFTESMQRKAESKRALTNELREALERRELLVHYQPIVDLRNGRIVKAEALLRWMHPSRGMVSPMEFIPLAEESGLILPIGEWVFHEAITTVERWRNRFGRLIQVSVNKSPLQFAQESGGGGWTERLREMNLPGSSIAVEITEGILIKDSPKVKNRLLDFHQRGIEVSIDDFGTGFSSLSYLKLFDVDFLKIDRAFVDGLAEDPSDRALTEAIIVMAHKLGIKTIAEGVETEAQRDLLFQFGCDYAQGYLFSRPVPAEAFEAMLASEGKSGGEWIKMDQSR